MKWFKHMSDMSQDVKVKRLIRKHGVNGYGLYNYIIELIVRKLDTDAPMPDLEESSEDIAADLSMDTLKVEEIIRFCVDQGLFEVNEVTGRLVAHKIYKFLDAASTRSVEIKRMIKAYQGCVELGNVPDSQRLSVPEQNRTEENRTEQNTNIRESEDPEVPDQEPIHHDFENQPHARVTAEWYRRYQTRTAKLIRPSPKDFKRCHETMQRGYTEDDLTGAMTAYFDPENRDFPQWDPKTQRFSYQFASFLANIDRIASTRASPSRAEQIAAMIGGDA